MRTPQHIERAKQVLAGNAGFLTAALVILLLAFIGQQIISNSRAATGSISLEAESGTTSPSAAVVSNTSASGGKAVKFGNILVAPTGLVAYTGGDSIALRWNDTKDPARFKQYNIYRGNTQIGTVTAALNPDYPEANGMGFVDKTVQAGAAYTYKVQSVDMGGATSPFSSTISVTQPSNMAVPAITIDTSQTTDLKAYMDTRVVPLLKIWYPKMTTKLAAGSYTPPTAFTLRIDPNYTGVAYKSGTTITAGADYVRSRPNDVGIWIHEAVHLVQKCGLENTNFWVTEGMADWYRYFIYRDAIIGKPAPTAKYTDGYRTTAYFFNWIATKYNPDFVPKMNLACYNGTYTQNFFQAETGRTVDQLWSDMQAAP